MQHHIVKQIVWNYYEVKLRIAHLRILPCYKKSLHGLLVAFLLRSFKYIQNHDLDYGHDCGDDDDDDDDDDIDDDDDDDGYPAYSHHDKNPPWWEFVSK